MRCITDIILFSFLTLNVASLDCAAATNSPPDYSVLERKVERLEVSLDAHQNAHTAANDLFDGQFKNLLTWGVTLVVLLATIFGGVLPTIFMLIQRKDYKDERKERKEESMVLKKCIDDAVAGMNGKLDELKTSADEQEKEFERQRQEIQTMKDGTIVALDEIASHSSFVCGDTHWALAKNGEKLGLSHESIFSHAIIALSKYAYSVKLRNYFMFIYDQMSSRHVIIPNNWTDAIELENARGALNEILSKEHIRKEEGVEQRVKKWLDELEKNK